MTTPTAEAIVDCAICGKILPEKRVVFLTRRVEPSTKSAIARLSYRDANRYKAFLLKAKLSERQQRGVAAATPSVYL